MKCGLELASKVLLVAGIFLLYLRLNLIHDEQKEYSVGNIASYNVSLAVMKTVSSFSFFL